jgi:hypothetical protein
VRKADDGRAGVDRRGAGTGSHSTWHFPLRPSFAPHEQSCWADIVISLWGRGPLKGATLRDQPSV